LGDDLLGGNMTGPFADGLYVQVIADEAFDILIESPVARI